MRSESDLETLFDRCMSIRVFGSDLILPKVQALSTKPPVFTIHWSPFRDPLLVVLVPTMVWFSSWLLFLWKIVSCKIKVQIIGEKMTFTSRHLVDPWEILPVSLWYFYLSSLEDVFPGRFRAVGSGAFIPFWGLVLLFIDWWLKLWS